MNYSEPQEVHNKELQSQIIANDIEKFLSSGGKINTYNIIKRSEGEVPPSFNNSPTKKGGYNQKQVKRANHRAMRAIELSKQGKSKYEIAEILGATVWTITNYLKREV